MWIKVTGRRGKRCKKLLHDLKENLKKKHYIALCGELALEEAMDLSQEGRQKWMQ